MRGRSPASSGSTINPLCYLSNGTPLIAKRWSPRCSMGNRHSHDQADEPQTEVNDVKLSALQEQVGDSPLFSIINFTNWGKTQAPGKVFKITPTTVEEVTKIVHAAAKFNLKVNYTKMI